MQGKLKQVCGQGKLKQVCGQGKLKQACGQGKLKQVCGQGKLKQVCGRKADENQRAWRQGKSEKQGRGQGHETDEREGCNGSEGLYVGGSQSQSEGGQVLKRCFCEQMQGGRAAVGIRSRDH